MRNYRKHCYKSHKIIIHVCLDEPVCPTKIIIHVYFLDPMKFVCNLLITARYIDAYFPQPQ